MLFYFSSIWNRCRKSLAYMTLPKKTFPTYNSVKILDPIQNSSLHTCVNFHSNHWEKNHYCKIIHIRLVFIFHQKCKLSVIFDKCFIKLLFLCNSYAESAKTQLNGKRIVFGRLVIMYQHWTLMCVTHGVTNYTT